MQLFSSPMYNLELVRELARKANYTVFSTTRALNCVIYQLEMDNNEAKQFILSEIIKLKEENFSKRIWQNGDIYDLYGKRISNIPWYIKFAIFKDEVGDEYLYNISFHPTEQILKTACEELEIFSQ